MCAIKMPSKLDALQVKSNCVGREEESHSCFMHTERGDWANGGTIRDQAIVATYSDQDIAVASETTSCSYNQIPRVRAFSWRREGNDTSSYAHVMCDVYLINLRVAQIIRLSSQDVPTAYAYELEAATIVQPEQVVEAVQKVVTGVAVPA